MSETYLKHVWIKSGPCFWAMWRRNMAQTCFRHVSDIFQTWFGRAVRTRKKNDICKFQESTFCIYKKMLNSKSCWASKHVWNMSETCLKQVLVMFQGHVAQKYGPGVFQTCSRHVSDMFQTWFGRAVRTRKKTIFVKSRNQHFAYTKKCWISNRVGLQNMSETYLKHVWNMSESSLGHVSGPCGPEIWPRLVSDMFQTCFRYVSDMF